MLFFAVFFQCHRIIFNSLYKSSFSVLTGCSSECCIYMIRIQFENSSQIFNSFINLTEFFMSTTSDIICSCIRRIYWKKLITIINSIVIKSFFHIRRCSNEQSFFMWWIDFKFSSTDIDKIVNIYSLYMEK